MSPRIPIAATLLGALVLAACTNSASNGSPTGLSGAAAPEGTPRINYEMPVNPTEGPEVLPTATSEATPSPREAAVQLVTEAYAKELGVAPDEVTLVSAESVEWPNSAMGCPEPGGNYLQMITPGFKVVVAHAEARATYHTSDGSMGPIQWVRCDAAGGGSTR
jgi:hypothetical protein